jgi:hypothetical protein
MASDSQLAVYEERLAEQLAALLVAEHRRRLNTSVQSERPTQGPAAPGVNREHGSEPCPATT